MKIQIAHSFFGRRLISFAGVGLLSGGLLFVGLGCQADAQPVAKTPMSTNQPPASGQSLAGTVQSYNLDMNGMYASMNIVQKDGRVVQVNFPAMVGPRVAKSVRVGDRISVTASPRLSMPDHPVYAMLTLTGADGKSIDVSHKPGRQQPQIQGKIARLNYDRQGRVNGAVLDSGEIVLLPSRAARRLDLQVGQDLRVQGRIRPAFGGGAVIVATRINGQAVGRPRGMAHGGGRMGGHHHWHHGGPPPWFYGRGMHMNGMNRQGMGGPWMQGQGMRGQGMWQGGPGGMGRWGMGPRGMQDGGPMAHRFGQQGGHGPRPTTGPADGHGNAHDKGHPGDQSRDQGGWRGNGSGEGPQGGWHSGDGGDNGNGGGQ
jgi:hypothetical protein